jgi:hypothetical protein
VPFIVGRKRRCIAPTLPPPETLPVPVIFIHVPRTGGTAICQTFGLLNSHAPAWERRRDLPPDLWTRSFKFAIVRNPWSQIASFHRGHSKKDVGSIKDFKVWVRQGMPTSWRGNPQVPDDPFDQLNFISQNGQDLMDLVLRFETLQASMPDLCSRLGVPERSLPPINGKAKDWDWRGLYDDYCVKVIGQKYSAFIERFGYTFRP